LAVTRPSSDLRYPDGTQRSIRSPHARHARNLPAGIQEGWRVDSRLKRHCRFSSAGALRDAARKRRLLRANGRPFFGFNNNTARAEEAPSFQGPSRSPPAEFIDTPKDCGNDRRRTAVLGFRGVRQ
jgi:hypothetical protein